MRKIVIKHDETYLTLSLAECYNNTEMRDIVSSTQEGLTELAALTEGGRIGLSAHQANLIDWDASYQQTTAYHFHFSATNIKTNETKSYTEQNLSKKEFKDIIYSLFIDKEPKFRLNGYILFVVCFQAPIEYAFIPKVSQKDTRVDLQYFKASLDNEIVFNLLGGSSVNIEGTAIFWEGACDLILLQAGVNNLEKIIQIKKPERVYCCGYPVADFRDFSGIQIYPSPVFYLKRFFNPQIGNLSRDFSPVGFQLLTTSGMRTPSITGIYGDFKMFDLNIANFGQVHLTLNSDFYIKDTPFLFSRPIKFNHLNIKAAISHLRNFHFLLEDK